jgi:Uma2 family endonuclease
MSPTTLSPPVTADEFAAREHKGFELVDGQVVEVAASSATAHTSSRVLFKGTEYTDPRQLGAWFSADGGIRCFPDDPERVRKPDAFFVRRERLPVNVWLTPFVEVAPDLAVEVVSPSIPVVWVIFPDTRTAWIHRADRGNEIFESGELEAEPVIPGFRCRLSDVLPRPVA